MEITMNDTEGYRDAHDDRPLPAWLAHDEIIAAVIGAWEQDERDRRGLALLDRVHRCAMAAVERDRAAHPSPFPFDLRLPSTFEARYRSYALRVRVWQREHWADRLPPTSA
ncbi:hypothetical protein [Terrabacter tumescens]|nr:hypothetical protein [Terrabacter tumescens]